MRTKCKKISVDFHGVINFDPVLFGAMMRLWHDKGIKIYVVSGGPHEYIAAYLQKHNIPYDNLWCIFDYFNSREKITVAADGSFHIDDELWNAAKGKFCAAEKIDLHIDDSNVYGKYFSTPYVQFDGKKRCFYTDTTCIYIKDIKTTAANLCRCCSKVD